MRAFFLLVMGCCFQISMAQSFSSGHGQSKLPIIPNRAISFDTDEGSNMNVDISPDGKSILFDILGEIYITPEKGGNAHQLTKGIGLNSCPIWSPNGNRFAYASDKSGELRLHVKDLVGKQDKLFGSRNGQLVYAYLESIWKDEVTIVNFRNEYSELGGISELPEGITSFISVSADRKSWFYMIGSTEGGYDIKSYNTVDGVHRKLYTHRKDQGSFLNPKISPDQKWLTYFKGDVLKGIDSLMICDLKTGREKLLASPGIRYPGPMLFKHYSFSADSKLLYIGYGGKIHRITIDDCRDDIIPFKAEVNIELGPLNYNSHSVSNQSLTVKYMRYAHRRVDGKQLAFEALNRIYVMDLPNGNPRILVHQGISQFQPCYSPNGKWITYVTWSDSTGGCVWKVPVDGGQPIKLTTVAAQYHNPSWSPDGKSIVVCKGKLQLGRRDNPGEGQIVILKNRSPFFKIIADSIPLLNRPVFTTDGQSIIFKPKVNFLYRDKPTVRLVSRNIENKTTRILGKSTSEQLDDFFYLFREILMSPNGKYMVFQNADNLYLAPAHLGEPITALDGAGAKELAVIRFAKGGFDPHWENNGKLLSWSFGNKYFSIDPEKIIDAGIKNRAEQGDMFTSYVDVKVEPDQIIEIPLVVPKKNAEETIAFKNARIISMDKRKVIENGTIIVKDGRIISVGQMPVMPPSASVFDMAGKTIIPRFIDVHDHMGVPPEVFPQQSWMYLSNLSYGITTARDPSGSHDMFGYEELLETGQMIGPRLYNVGNAVRPYYRINSLKEARIIAENRKKMGATVVKQYGLKTRLERQWLNIACRENGLNMTNEGGSEFLEQLGMIKDGSAGVEHNPMLGECYKDVITFLARCGTFLTPTLQVSYSRLDQLPKEYFEKNFAENMDKRYLRFTPLEVQQRLMANKESKVGTDFVTREAKIDAEIYKKGGKIVMGSHGEDKGIGAHFEIWALQMGGLTNMETLEVSTIRGAEALGMQKDLGSLETGKIADLLILDKNPLEDIHNTNSIRYVMKNGVLYDAETLDTIWPYKKKLPEWRMKTQPHEN